MAEWFMLFSYILLILGLCCLIVWIIRDAIQTDGVFSVGAFVTYFLGLSFVFAILAGALDFTQKYL